jgi:hypothetical protein
MNAFETEMKATLAAGTEVEVLTRYEPHWASGFEIESVDLECNQFTLRRNSDGAVLPATFSAREVRARQ